MLKNYILKNYTTLQYILLCCISFFPLFPRGIESTIMILMTLLSLLYFVFEGHKYWSRIKSKQLLLASVVFIIILLSVFYSENTTVAIRYLKTLLPLILFPFAFLVSEKPFINSIRLEKLFNFYIIAVFLVLFITNIWFFKEIYIDKMEFIYLRNSIETFLDVHGTYLSMWVGFGVLLTVYQGFKNLKNKRKLSFYIFLLIYFAYWLFVIKARMPMFATAIATSLYILLEYKISFRVIILAILSLFIITFLFFSDKIVSRYETLKNYNKAFPHGKYEDHWAVITNENIRSGIYFCSFQTILNNPILGVGIGDVDDLLQCCYDKEFYYTDVYLREKYNSHSQYLLFLLASGFVGLIAYFFWLFLLIKISISKKLHLYFGFLIFVTLCFTFENVLSRHDGVIFFSLFNIILLVFRNDNEQT